MARGGAVGMSGKRNDERVKLTLDPETALRALLVVKPDDEQPRESHASDQERGNDPGPADGDE
jgi:hypothetical protein